MQVAIAHRVHGWAVGGRRCVKTQQPPDAIGRRRPRLFSLAGDDDGIDLQGKVPAFAARLVQAALHSGQGRTGEKRQVAEGVDDQPVRHLPRHFGHHGTQRPQQHRGWAEGIGAGIEHGRHQRVAIVFALKRHFPALLPAGEDCLECLYVLAHPRRRRTEFNPKAVLDMRLDLGADPQQEAALAEGLQVPGLVRKVHGIARKSDSDTGGYVQLRRVLGSQHQRIERVPAALEGINAIVSYGRKSRRFCCGIAQLGVERTIYFHRHMPVGCATLEALNTRKAPT